MNCRKRNALFSTCALSIGSFLPCKINYLEPSLYLFKRSSYRGRPPFFRESSKYHYYKGNRTLILGYALNEGLALGHAAFAGVRAFGPRKTRFSWSVERARGGVKVTIKKYAVILFLVNICSALRSSLVLCRYALKKQHLHSCALQDLSLIKLC